MPKKKKKGKKTKDPSSYATTSMPSKPASAGPTVMTALEEKGDIPSLDPAPNDAKPVEVHVEESGAKLTGKAKKLAKKQKQMEEKKRIRDAVTSHEHSSFEKNLSDHITRDGVKVWVKKGFVENMKTDGCCYANDVIFEQIMTEMKESSSTSFIPSLKQVANVASLPGIIGYSLAMPDMHTGYGFSIGGVCAIDADDPEGVVSPGGVGFDINCGVRLVRTNLTEKEVEKKKNILVDSLFDTIPVGVGGKSSFISNLKDLDRILNEGVSYLEEKGLAWPEDRECIEEKGAMPMADATLVSKRAKQRGLGQAGSLGSGNHYIEVQVVDEVFDEKSAAAMGLKEGQVCVMIHSGSRGLGHQVCTDHLQVMHKAMADQSITVNDRQLASVRIHSKEGQHYLGAMASAANYAFCNRGLMTSQVRDVFSQVFGESPRDLGMHVVYDVSHNIAKMEKHQVKGPDGVIQQKNVLVHRKGATRAFGPNHPDLPERYKETGQPVLIGGSMGTCSYVLTGTETAMAETFGSTCHGAGRALSRSQAKKTISSKGVLSSLQEQGVVLRCAQKGLISEEAPGAYKDVSEVVDTCHEADISRKAVRLRPLCCIKGFCLPIDIN